MQKRLTLVPVPIEGRLLEGVPGIDCTVVCVLYCVLKCVLCSVYCTVFCIWYFVHCIVPAVPVLLLRLLCLLN